MFILHSEHVINFAISHSFEFPVRSFSWTVVLLDAVRTVIRSSSSRKGTLRKNLDPYEECDDQEIWEVLALTSLKIVVSVPIALSIILLISI